ncbi:hypothetical protein J2W30_004485 [Variovorax boronicumulans]|nr:hypothetical protein [Variovorax boronicumulans]
MRKYFRSWPERIVVLDVAMICREIKVMKIGPSVCLLFENSPLLSTNNAPTAVVVAKETNCGSS